MGQLYKSSSSQLQSDTKPCHSRNTILVGLWERPQITSTPASRVYAMIPESRLLNLEADHLALAIAKEPLDKITSELHRKQQTEKHRHSR